MLHVNVNISNMIRAATSFTRSLSSTIPSFATSWVQYWTIYEFVLDLEILFFAFENCELTSKKSCFIAAFAENLVEKLIKSPNRF